MKKLVALFLFIIIVPATGLSQEEDYSKYSGYVDLNKIDEFKDSEATVEIFITKTLLSLIASASKEEDPPLVKLLSNLVLIRVDQFTVKEKKAEEIKKLIIRISDKLTKDKWSKIVRVKEANERVEIFIKNEKKQVAGLLIMSLNNNGETTFVNIVGNIDRESLGKLSRQFNIPKLDSLATEEKKKEQK